MTLLTTAAPDVVKRAAEWRARRARQQDDARSDHGAELAFMQRGETRPGEYGSVCCGALWSSSATQSGSLWPSLWALLHRSWLMRVQLRGAPCDVDLRDVFRGGSEPAGPLYCLNASALSFKPGCEQRSA